MSYDNQNNNRLPDNVSGLRFMLSEVNSTKTRFIESYDEARNTENSVAIMEGDWGGQIYLTCPVSLIRCDESILQNLLDDLDNIAWDCNEGEGKGIYYEVRNIGEGIAGGMGGATVANGIWIHKEFKEKGFESQIVDIINGKRDKL